MRQSPREPSPRPPPPDNPLVESWLDSIPASTTKPTPEELRQWDLDDRDHSGIGSFVTGIVIRSFSFLIATVVVIVVIVVLLPTRGYYYNTSERLVPTLVVTPIIAVWDTAEFITLCALRGRGISPRIHVWIDGLLFLGTAAATAMLMVDIIIDLYYHIPVVNKAKDIACAAMLIILMLIHSFLFFFYFCARLGRRRKENTKPRIMYLPTGHPVIVTSRPLAIHRATPQQATELTQLQMPRTTAPFYAQAAVPSPTLVSPPPPQPNLPIHDPVDGSFHKPFRQGVPPRKPVAGATVGTHYAIPWPGPEYQPDEAERVRAARGEKQAQWMTLYGMGLEGEGLQGSVAMDPNKTRREEMDEANLNASAGKARVSF